MTVIRSSTLPIDCPEHSGEHKAVLYQWPHRFAGIWECPVSGSSDVHDHSLTIGTEIIEDHFWLNGRHQTEREIYICTLDGVAIELDGVDGVSA